MDVNVVFIDDAHSCISQFIKQNNIPDDCAVIVAWDNEMARKILGTTTKDGDFSVHLKSVKSYTNVHIIAHITKMWDKGLFPIELITKDTGIFFGVPKDAVLNKKFDNYTMLPAEDSDSIPDVKEFDKRC